MSIPVSLGELREVAAAFGSTPYLRSVGSDATPHAASVAVAWSGDVLVAGAGMRVASNVERNDQVALLWPVPRSGDYALVRIWSAKGAAAEMSGTGGRRRSWVRS
jgi:hypothetical protein